MQRTDELQEHIRSLHRFATGLTGNRTDAEDLVQECLRRVIAHLKSGNQVQNLRAYLFRTLRNVHIDQCRERAGKRHEVGTDGDEIERIGIPPNQEDRLHCADISAAMDRLPACQREVILLACIEGLAYDEVAEVTGTPVGTVRSRLHRGRATLREMLEPAMFDARREPGGTNIRRIGKLQND